MGIASYTGRQPHLEFLFDPLISDLAISFREK